MKAQLDLTETWVKQRSMMALVIYAAVVVSYMWLIWWYVSHASARRCLNKLGNDKSMPRKCSKLLAVSIKQQSIHPQQPLEIQGRESNSFLSWPWCEAAPFSLFTTDIFFIFLPCFKRNLSKAYPHSMSCDRKSKYSLFIGKRNEENTTVVLHFLKTMNRQSHIRQTTQQYPFPQRILINLIIW